MVERGGGSLTNAQPTVRLAQIPAHFRMVRALLGMAAVAAAAEGSAARSAGCSATIALDELNSLRSLRQ